MIAAELRGGSKPSLNEALGWIGSRVDDIYGANVGRLDDVWIDPGTGVPRWLLVKEGRFGGRTTLIPFEDATAGAGHVWVPYERDVVRDAPEIESGAPLTQYVEAALRSHYAANSTSSFRQGEQTPPQPIGRQAGSTLGTATVRFHTPPEAGPPEFFAQQRAEAHNVEHHAPPQRPVLRPQQPPPAQQPPRMPERPAPPIAAPEPPREQPREWVPRASQAYVPPQQPYAPAQQPYEPQQQPYVPPQQAYVPPQQPYAPPPQQEYVPPQQAYVPPQRYRPLQQQAYVPPDREPAQGPRAYAPQQPVQPQRAADAAQAPIDQLRSLAEHEGTHYVEIELTGELTIRGELRSVKVTPREASEPDHT